MSEFLEAAAKAVGGPAELVLRSAEARAGAEGVSVEEVLQTWAGGSATVSSPPEAPTPPPVSAPTAPEPPEPVSAPVAPEPASVTPTPEPPRPVSAPIPASAPPAQPAATSTGPPPVLKGRRDRPFRYFFGAAALLIMSLVVTVVLPPLSDTGRGAFHSRILYTESARSGQTEYLVEGCAGCHTQLVRPIVADAQLAAVGGQGGVTLSDTNQVIGRQRYGPDLANVGNRLSLDALATVLSGEGGHVQYRGDRMDSLVAYLMESRVSTEDAVGE